MNVEPITVAFALLGPPVPLERARHGKGRTYSAPRSVAYQRALAYAFRAASLVGKWPLDARYHVTIVVTFADHRRRDIDNVAKTVLDGLNRVAWADDSQVDRLTIERASPCPSTAGVVVKVERVEVATVATLGRATKARRA